MNNVLVLSVHPDDETLGCGGTLLKHKSITDKIYWFIITGIKEEYGFNYETILVREKEIEKVSKIYGFNDIIRLDLPPTRLDEIGMSNLVSKISDIFNKVKPEVIYLPFKGDVHSDHRKIFEASFSCTKIFRYPYIKKILMMETISETEFSPSLPDSTFIPNYFVDITDFFDKKLEILKIYGSELGEHPFPRSLENIKALATFRGAMAGCKYAESFMILKEIW